MPGDALAMPELLQGAESLVRLIDPHGASVRPLSIKLRSELPAEFDGGDSAYFGLYFAAFAFLLDRDTGGRRAVIVLNDILHREIYGHGVRHDNKFLGTALHEYAHAIEDTSELAMAPDFESLSPFDQLVATPEIWRQAVEGGLDLASTGKPLWHGHGERFIRACAHLWHRASEAGCWLSPVAEFRFAGERYGVSSPYAYIATLRDELVARAADPIREILDTEPPAAFAELWAADTKQEGN